MNTQITTITNEARAILNNKNYDAETNETWYEGTIAGSRIRILQEEPGSGWFYIEITPANRQWLYVSNADGYAMFFESAEDAIDELTEQITTGTLTF